MHQSQMGSNNIIPLCHIKDGIIHQTESENDRIYPDIVSNTLDQTIHLFIRSYHTKLIHGGVCDNHRLCHSNRCDKMKS